MAKHDSRQTAEIAELLLSGMPPSVVIETLRAPRELVYDIRRSLGSAYPQPSLKTGKRIKGLRRTR